MTDVVLFKLINGEEIMSQVDKITNEEIHLVDPLLVQIQEDERGNSGMMLITYVPFGNNNKLTVMRSSVATIHDMNELMTTYYRKSLDYSKKHHIERYNKSLKTAIEYLDRINLIMDGPEEDPYNKPRRPSKLSKSDLVVVSNTPSSNTIN